MTPEMPFPASGLFGCAAASMPTNIKPAWLIDEYASMRLTFVCVTARSEPTTMLKSASTQIMGRQSSTRVGNAVKVTRSRAANAAVFPADAINAVTGVGAPWYTSGVHM